MKLVSKIVKKLYLSIYDMVMHDGIEHAGYLSFLMMLAIFPSLFFFMAVIGVFDDKMVSDFIVEKIVHSPGASFLEALRPRIVEITSSPPQTFITIAIVGAIWTASSIFEALRFVINKAYRVQNTPAYILRRMLSIAEFLVAMSAILIVIFIYILLPIIPEFFKILLSYNDVDVSDVIDLYGDIARQAFIIFFGFVTLIFLYSWLPNRSVSIMQAAPGAIVTLVGWYLASSVLKFYIQHFHQVNVIYGSIAGVIIALLYFHICSIIVIVGAEFNYHMSMKGVKN